MVELYRSPRRAQLQQALVAATSDVLIATPYIKRAEVQSACDQLVSYPKRKPPRLRVMTDLRAESVLAGSLDLAALMLFQDTVERSEIVNLPHLHAKVYVFDDTLAIVGSANLTRSGLDSNYEYSVGLRDPVVVRKIRDDMDSYARIGNLMRKEDLVELSRVADEVGQEYRGVLKSATVSARRKFNETLTKTHAQFAAALVGSRSAQSLFSEAILYALSKGPLPTRDLHPHVQRLLPDLSDDSVELVINGERFGKAWKHQVRNAQQGLKKKGLIAFDGARWQLVR